MKNRNTEAEKEETLRQSKKRNSERDPKMMIATSIWMTMIAMARMFLERLAVPSQRRTVQ
jgi:hypothetical protein